MNPDKAEKLANDLLEENGLLDWQFKFDNAKVRFGNCDYSKKTISLSFYLTVLNSESEVNDCIRHEVAHALAGHHNGHNDTWKSTARSLGASASRTYDDLSVKVPTGKWIGVCSESCGFKTKPRHRRDKGRCPRCLSAVRWENAKNS